jgi:hypothetical protein
VNTVIICDKPSLSFVEGKVELFLQVNFDELWLNQHFSEKKWCLEEDEEIGTVVAYVCDRKCRVTRDGVMETPKLGRKITPHLNDAFQGWLIILALAALYPVAHVLSKMLQRLEVVRILNRILLVLGTVAVGGWDKRLEGSEESVWGIRGTYPLHSSIASLYRLFVPSPRSAWTWFPSMPRLSSFDPFFRALSKKPARPCGMASHRIKGHL